MTLSLLFSVVALTVCINIGHCLGSDHDAKVNTDVYQGLTDRELILTLVKRIDDLEEWNHKQQKDIIYLQATNRKQARKLTVMERILKQRYKPVEPMDNQESSLKDDLSDTSKARIVASHHVPMSSAPGLMAIQRQQERSAHRRQTGEGIQVAFYATLSNHISGLGKNQALEFENVTTNIGHGYNPHTGTFIAPFGGTYVFSTTLMANSRTESYYFLTKNGSRISRLFTRGIESPYSTTSHTYVLHLQKNDDVEIRNGDAGHDVHGDEYSCFSGFLLYPDDEPVLMVG